MSSAMALESGLTRIVADQVALARATTNTQKMKAAMKNQWDIRKKLKASNENDLAFEMVIRAQIDEVFLVLAHLGEAILPLGVFNKDYYLQTLGDVQAAIANCGHELLPVAWGELDAELQYVCTAGLAICACYAPMPLYRGFGACVLSDYDWACPDIAHLEEKAKKKALWTVYGIKQRVDPQATRSVFLAFDQAIQMLQVKPMAFLTKRPAISSIAEHQPHFGAKPKKEVREKLDLLEDWVKQLERRGHPAPKASRLTSWGIPFATWTSPYSCHIMKAAKDCETLAYHQMDPGRLLHAFVCRASASLDEGQVLVLLPGSPAESLLSWLEGLPGMSHKIVRWEDLDTMYFESKIPKSLRKRIGQYPLPTQYAVRNTQASTRLSLPMSSSRSPLEHPNTVSPPPYSMQVRPQRSQIQLPVAELGLADPSELPTSPEGPAPSLPPRPDSTRSAPPATTAAPNGLGVSAGTKSIHTLRRKPPASATAPTPVVATAAVAVGTPAVKNAPAQELDSVPKPAEMPVDAATAPSVEMPALTAVELPTDYHIDAPAPLRPSKSYQSMRNSSVPSVNIVAPTVTEEPKSVANTLQPPQSPYVNPQPQPAGTKNDSHGSPLSPEASSQDTGSSDHYLALLTKVASGEISPQALSEMLSKGNGAAGQSKAQATNEYTAQPPTSTTTPERSLPYPLKEEERSLPYPLSPTDGPAFRNEDETRAEAEIPAALRPGNS
ncbi:uncharacterized protein LTR77_000974 [Saxophila tyrrhenica]|uniref:Uncharacterized protein n=1 Tax=Saxophila tyrrhenica TaxID=1690608 RepID=A0AAV9PP49_9PEZI|nr:hypothetical protein LTR77_000974 [Saxophila tyrrhenica]